MKLRYLGTAAAEGIPAVFCNCANCKKAAAEGGRAIRTRSQAFIDGKLLIDWPADSYAHLLKYGIDSSRIETVIITHIHEDHYYTPDFSVRRPGFSHPESGSSLDIYGSCDIEPLAAESKKYTDNQTFFTNVHIVEPFRKFSASGYEITPLPAIHGTPNPLIYAISDGKKSLLYAHDTDVPQENTVSYLKENHFLFDYVSLDCTEGTRHIDYSGHMNLERCIEAREKFISAGIADSHTVFCMNHFSHNGANCVYSEMAEIAKSNGFIISYDGKEVDI